MLCVSFSYGQDAGADAAKATLQTGVRQFQAKQYASAQATLLKVDRKALDKGDRDVLARYLIQVGPAVKSQSTARSALAAAEKSLAANRLDEAREGFAAAAASPWLTADEKNAAGKQLALVKQRKAAAAVKTPDKQPVQPVADGATDAVARIKARRAKARDYLNKGKEAYKKGNYEQAKSYFRQAIELAPDLVEAQRGFDDAHASSAKFSTGRSLVTRIHRERAILRRATETDIAVALQRAEDTLAKADSKKPKPKAPYSAMIIPGGEVIHRQTGKLDPHGLRVQLVKVFQR